MAVLYRNFLGSATGEIEDESFRDEIKSLQLGKGDFLDIDYLPPIHRRWLSAHCRRRGIRLYVRERKPTVYKIQVMTTQMEKERLARQDEETRRREDYYNCPG